MARVKYIQTLILAKKRGGSITNGDVSIALNISYSYANQIINALVAAGMLSKIGRGVYSITSRGLRYLENMNY